MKYPSLLIDRVYFRLFKGWVKYLIGLALIAFFLTLSYYMPAVGPTAFIATMYVFMSIIVVAYAVSYPPRFVAHYTPRWFSRNCKDLRPWKVVVLFHLVELGVYLVFLVLYLVLPAPGNTYVYAFLCVAEGTGLMLRGVAIGDNLMQMLSIMPPTWFKTDEKDIIPEVVTLYID